MASVTHEQYLNWIATYALGALAEPECDLMKAHLAKCSACREQYYAEQALTALLPQAVEPIEPSPETKLKLFARVDSDLAARQADVSASVDSHAAEASSHGRRLFVWIALAVLGLLVIAAAFLLLK